MKRLLPRSLFSRLVMVFLAGLVVAQGVSLAIILQDRGELLSRASGMQLAQRMADIVILLDSLSPAERVRIVAVLGTAPMRISLRQTAPPAALHEAGEAGRPALFAALLQRLLGEGRIVNVAVHDGPFAAAGGPPFAGHRGHRETDEMRGRGMRGNYPGLSILAQVRLQDGNWVSFDTRVPEETWNWPQRALLGASILLLGVVVLSLVGVRLITRPLKVFADAAEQLGRNIDSPPLPETGPLEVARAARALNTMQSRLSRYLHDRTRILAAMSHDLKTPITRLRLRAELLDDAPLRHKFTKDLGELESMVGETLDFMRGLESGEPLQRADINAMLESMQADTGEVGGRMLIEGVAASPLQCRPQALKRCLSNLIGNAIHYGKVAHVGITDSGAGLCISVRDEGPGVPEAELERVFEPFYRLESSRSRDSGGTGLGLAIARNIAEQHGGTLSLRNVPGGGLEAMLTLPR